MLHHIAGTPEREWLLFSLIFILETVVVAIFRPKAIKLLNAIHQQPHIPPLAGPAPGAILFMLLQPMLPAQQAQPYGSGSSQQFLPLGHTNVAMSQPSQIQFPQPMQQVTDRPVVGMHSMPQGPPIPHDFQRNLPMSNNHMPGSGGPNLPLSSSYNKTGELAAPLVVPVRIQCVLLYPFCTNIVNKYYYNKVTRTSKRRMPDEVKLAHKKDTISLASDFGSISVVKTSSSGADSSLVSAHGAKSSPIAVSPVANLPTIVASESSSLSGKVSSPKQQQQQQTQCIPTWWGLGGVGCTQSIPIPLKK
ncbi:hypothetical protein T459_28852 [Capsicum annuum]|uniref:Uncharacterized protein n=1 Tax=Capsicum annuum TaxID=4072 RepID=A0A2G2YI10_CAPAN|nr:hypothetical protein T459_28852 [Capsicum annuum]